jgi:hypothetical protein
MFAGVPDLEAILADDPGRLAEARTHYAASLAELDVRLTPRSGHAQHSIYDP